MLKKEMLTANGCDGYHFKFKLGEEEEGPSYFIGFRRKQYGVYRPVGEALSPIPYWGSSENFLQEIMTAPDGSKSFCKSDSPKYMGEGIVSKVSRVDSHGNVLMTIKDEERTVMDVYSSYSKMFSRDDLGSVAYILFAPPLPDIYKKVKQVFTRSRKEGVVNVGERDAYSVSFGRRGSYRQSYSVFRKRVRCGKCSTDFTKRRSTEGLRAFGCLGKSSLQWVGWGRSRANYHKLLKKYTQRFRQFSSGIPNGELIRRSIGNLGVTPQLEVSYAA